MKKLYTIPSVEKIAEVASRVPPTMVPNLIPHACVAEGILSKETCDALNDEITYLARPYKFHGCDAMTREVVSPFSRTFNPVITFAREANKSFWNFELNNTPTAWLQVYNRDKGYALHADAMIGAMRKLTVVALLSDEIDYSGGILRVMPYPDYHPIPKTQGTLVAFPSWVLHEVTPVIDGQRVSLNVGFYGPPFK